MNETERMIQGKELPEKKKSNKIDRNSFCNELEMTKMYQSVDSEKKRTKGYLKVERREESRKERRIYTILSDLPSRHYVHVPYLGFG